MTTDAALMAEMEQFIVEMFERNFEELRMESGHAISPDVKQTALQQVLLYWKVLNEIAQNVTDTEVRLSLPNQDTPKGRTYSIEGVVDILRDNERTIMYDIKTHNSDFVKENIDVYEQQLNVYAHIWQNLRGQGLDGTAVIATDFPAKVRNALELKNEVEIAYALESWDPVVPIQYDLDKVQETIRKFGRTVDDIEDGVFTPPPVATLKTSISGSKHKVSFATHVCRNCDARFSCSSYRGYAWGSGYKPQDSAMAKYLAESLPDDEQELWRSGNLVTQPDSSELRVDFSSR